ncbi:FUSC family protein [Microbacterium sp. CH12i]|uniref:FUSC family protein n=1 Tax=Microbacterium sp. CH12i TaxID=1479651 RepID=UPI00068AAD36|nr:FUSC family protein [Microbacterium sp. CH12i]
MFFVLVYGLTAYVVGIAPVTGPMYLAAYTAGCLFSYLLALTPFVLSHARAVKARPLRELLPGPSLDLDSRMLLLRVAIVAVIGALIGYFLHPDRTYWIVGAAVAVIGLAAVRRTAFQRGLHRMVGSLAGAGVYVLIAAFVPHGIWLALILAAMQFTIELVVVRHYALALMFITPLVLILSGAASGQPVSLDVAAERILDTLIGAGLGAVSGVLHPKPTPESDRFEVTEEAEE